MANYKRNKNQLRLAGNGIIAENFPITAVASNTAVTSQTAYYALVGFNAGDVITNIHVAVGTVPSGGSTNLFVGVYSTAGVRLAVSNDLTTGADTTGIKTLALSAPYTVTADGAYYLAFLQVNAGTPSALNRGNGTSASMGAVGAGVRNLAAQAGISALPDPATFSAGALGLWMAAS